MAKLDDLQKKRAALLKQIKEKGGKEAAPKLAQQLASLDKDIRAERGDAPKASEGDIKLDKSEKKVLEDVKGGQGITNALGFDKPLSRLSTDVPDDQKALIESIRQLADPSSEAFVGKRSGEEKGVVDLLKGLSDEAGETTPEESKALGALRDVLDRAGVRSEDQSSLLSRLKGDSETRGERTADTADVISRLKTRADTAGQRSKDMQETLDLMKGGLAGLNAAENTALREQAQAEVDRKYRAAVEDLQTASRASGMQSAGAAGSRNARRDAMMAQADLEQKNLLNNIKVQDDRRKTYADTLGGQEQDEFDRGSEALRDYGAGVEGAETRENQRYSDAITAYRNQLSDTEKTEFDQREGASRNYAAGVNDYTANRFNRMGTAAGRYADTVTTLGQNERERVRGALGDYGNSLTDRNNFWLDTSKVNLGQERTDRAASVQSALGFAGLSENERARKRALRQGKRRGGDGRVAGQTGAVAGTPAQPGYSAQDYLNEIQNIYNQYGA